MTSKSRKKQLKRQYRDQQVQAETTVLVVSPLLTAQRIEGGLPKRYAAIGIAPEVFGIVEPGVYRAAQPGNRAQEAQMTLGQIDAPMLDSIADFDLLLEQPVQTLLGQPFLSVTAQLARSPVNDLLFTATLRALGPLSEGVLVNLSNRSAMDDWQAWSLDYMGTTVADMTRVYDDDCPDFAALLEEHPDLIYRKPWWRFW